METILYKFKKNASDLFMVKMITRLPSHLEIDSYLLTIFLIDLELSFMVWLGSVLKVPGGINHKESYAQVTVVPGPLATVTKSDLG